MLSRLLPLLRQAFPRARFLVQLDGGFATPEVFDFLEAEQVDYVVAIARNAVLLRQTDIAMRMAHALSDSSGQSEHVFTDTCYRARTWSTERRGVRKAEVGITYPFTHERGM